MEPNPCKHSVGIVQADNHNNHQIVGANMSPKDWLRVNEAVAMSGFCRSLIYELIKSQSIKTYVRKRHKNALRGIRLINADSLRDYLNNGYEKAQAEKGGE